MTRDIILTGGTFDIETVLISEFIQSQFSELYEINPGYIVLETMSNGLLFQDMTEFSMPDDMDVMRLQLFNTLGDLTFRRDERTIYWRYVGYTLAWETPPGKSYVAHDPQKELSFNVSEDHEALLWGKYDAQRGQYYEGRVGGADLHYPLQAATPPRAVLRAHVIRDETHDVVAYWTYMLGAAQPQMGD